VRHLGECPIFAVASPAYIKAHGAPKTPADLKNHRLIAYSNVGGSMEWRYKDADGKTGSIKQDGVFRANTAEMMLQAALDGLGIAILPIFSVATHLKAKQLVRVLPGYESHPMRQIAALMPPSRHRLRKVKLLVDWLAQACKAMPLG
jgi:DNA-binding transcriptional LysR family regulator